MLQLPQNIRLIRLLSGKTQTEFGQKFDASKAMVISYEKGKASPDELFISRVAKYACVTPQDLMMKRLKEEDVKVEKEENVSRGTFIEERRTNKLNGTHSEAKMKEGVPIYDVPIDASFLERYREEEFHPLYYLNIPKLRNCNFGAIISGSSMYPILKSGSIAMCRIVDDINYIDPGEMYLISTTNGFETVKYVQPGDKKDELQLIPHNEKIKPTTIKKTMIIRICIVEAWISFR